MNVSSRDLDRQAEAAPSTIELAIARELLEQIRQSSEIDDVDWNVLLLRLGGCDFEEIEKQLNIPEHVARRKMKKVQRVVSRIREESR